MISLILGALEGEIEPEGEAMNTATGGYGEY